MDNLLGYLKKYQDRLNQTKLISAEIIETIKEVVGLELSDSEMKVNNKNLYLKTTTKAKLSILLQKDQVIEAINQKLGEKIILNIK